MNFFLGILFGAMLAGGGGQHTAILGDIPLRCLAALEQSDDAYRQCRIMSLAAAMQQQYQNSNDLVTGMGRGKMQTAVAEALTWEIKALKTLEAEARKREGK